MTSQLLITLILILIFTKCPSNGITTALFEIHDNERNSMHLQIKLVFIIKKHFSEFTYVNLNCHGWLDTENEKNKSNIENESLKTFFQALVLNDTSSWNNGEIPLLWRSPSPQEIRRNVTKERNMLGVNVRVTTLYNPPMSMLKMNGSRKILTGYIGDIWHDIQDILQFSEQLFIRLSSKPPVSYNFYLQPFSSNIWLMIVFMFICILPLMHTLLYWLSPNHNYLNISNGMQDGMKYQIKSVFPLSSRSVDTFSHLLVDSFGIFCQQGLQCMPESQAVRLSLYVTMLSSIVMYNVYSGSLTSFLAVDRQLKPQFTSMENLLQSVKHSGLSIGVLENSSLISVLSDQSSGLYKEVWDIISDSEFGLVPTRFEGFQRACVEDFVFFTMKASYEGYRKFLQPCELYGIPESNLDAYVGISISKGYEYAELLDDLLLRMNEVGMLHRQRLKWWPAYYPEEYTYAAAQKDAVETGTSDPIMKITFGHITFAIKLLLSGISLSLIIFLCEKVSAW